MALWNRRRGRPRRVDRIRPEGDRPWYSHLRSRRTVSQLAVLVGVWASAVLVVQLPRPPLPYRKGEIAPRPLVARVDFDYVDTDVTQQVKELAARRVSNVYRPQPKAVIAARQSLLDLVDQVAAAETPGDMPEKTPEAWGLDESALAAMTKALGPEKANRESVAEAIQGALDPLADPLQLAIFTEEDRDREIIRLRDIRALRDALPAGLPAEVQPLLGPAGDAISLVLAEGRQAVPARSVHVFADSDQARVAIGSRVASLAAQPLSAVFGRAGAESVAAVIAGRIGPTLVYDQVGTENLRAEAKSGVAPIRVQIKAGATLVAEGVELTSKDIRILSQEQSARREQFGPLRKTGEWLGVGAVVALVLLVQVLYTLRYQPQVARSVPRGLMLCLLFLLVLGGSKAVAQSSGAPAFASACYTFFLTTAGMIVAIAYTQVYAVMLVWSLVLLAALATRGDFGWALTGLVGSGMAVLSLGEISNRSKLIKVGALAGLAMLVAAGGLALWELEGGRVELRPALVSAFWYFVSGLVAGFVMLGLLPFIERAFGIVTNISLLELCDVNQPALRRLAIEAPGTYTHSLLIGSLAEAAAEAIGANGLLARVGAYFHDIGKVNKPHYFVENWQEEGETHEGLTPAMSRLVIQSHVKDGLEMAERMGLPPLIQDFIAEHHGTTMVSYFYQAAERQQAANGGEAPSKEDYRYGGPKPHSAETSVVMLADAVEGATRSLKEPAPGRVRDTVHEVVMGRLLDGQLDASGLTLRDVHIIEETLTKGLVSVYHGRVPYPKDRPQEPSRDEAREADAEASYGSRPDDASREAGTGGAEAEASGSP